MSDTPNSLHQKLHNLPHLMTAELFNSVESSLNLSEVQKEASITESRWKSEIDDLQYNEDTGVGILPIVGMITYEESYYWWMETTSYKGLLTDAKTMIDAGATTIVLDVDSGGGLAYGMMETASLLRKMADENGVKLIAYNDGLSASAAYGLSSVAHEFISNPDAETGSIGVVVSLTDYSGYDKKNGIKRIFKTAGEGKVPYTEDGGFTKEFLDDIQSKVDKLYDRFTSHVAQYRPMEQADVKSLGAKVYTADEALENGLIDEIMTREEFFTYLAEVSSVRGKNMIGDYFNKTEKKDKQMSKPEDLQAAMTAAKADFEIELQSQIDGLKTKLSAEFESKLSAKDAELNTALEALKEVAKEKAEAKTANRKATLAAIVGDVQAEAKAAKMADLSDEAFADMVEMLQSMSTEADKSVLNTELGDEGQEVVADPVDAVTAYREKTKARYEQKYTKKGAK